jgi:hypothetical protein
VRSRLSQNQITFPGFLKVDDGVAYFQQTLSISGELEDKTFEKNWNTSVKVKNEKGVA